MADETPPKRDNSSLFEAAFGPSPVNAVLELDRLIGQTDDAPQLAVLHALHGAALVGTNDIAGAGKAFDVSNKLNAEERFGDRMQFLAGLVRERHDQSSLALDKLLAVAPDLVRDLDVESVYTYLADTNGTPRSHLDDQRIALAKIGYGGLDGTYLTLNAIRILLDRNQDGEAAELIAYLDSLSVVQNALVDRRFERLWPSFATSAGDHGAKISAESIRKARVEVDANPTDSRKSRNLMDVLANARRYEEANRIGAGFAANTDQLAALDEDGGWVVNEHALILLKMGKLADADRRYEDLIRSNSAKPWVVNMMINRAELLTQTGRFEAAAKVLADIEAFTAKNGNPYARQLVRRLKLCNAIGLKQTAAIPALLAAVKVHSTDSLTATVEALLCANDRAGAENITLEMLNDINKADGLIVLLQRKPFDRDDPSMWVTSWQSLRGNPAIDAAFNKLGRDLPDLYQVE